VLSALVGAFEIPAQQALLPHLVPRADMMNAISLNSLVRKGAQVIGPSLGGVSVAAFGVAPTYFLNAASYVVLIVMILMMRTTNPPTPAQTRSAAGAIADGLRYVRGDAVIATLLLMESVVSIFGSFNPMLVVFAREVFHVGAEGLGLLQSAAGIGTIIGSVVLSFIGDIHRKGRLIIAGGVVYGLAVIAFAVTPWFPLAIVFLILTGAAEVSVGATRTTVMQLFTKREMLGRVMSLQAMSTRGLGPLGGFEAGTLGTLIGVPYAVALGGLVCIATVLAAARAVPTLRNFTGAGREEEAAFLHESRRPVTATGESAVAAQAPSPDPVR
jgi:MFS family permease